MPGDRIPGVRKLSRQFGVSISTVVRAQRLLEDESRIEARPRSGYYVRARSWPVPDPPTLSRPSSRPTPVTGQALVLRLVQASNEPGFVRLGAAVPHSSFLPTRALQRSLSSVLRKHGNDISTYQFPPGNPELRRQIAHRMAEAGCQVNPDDIIITSGCQEAITLSLQSIAGPGDIIALESPAFYGLLQAIETLGMKALEIPTDPRTGISLAALSLALEKWPVKACVLVPNFSNPLGCSMPEANKQALMTLLTQHNVPLRQVSIMTRAVVKFFPEGTRVTQPQGGFVIWVELPGKVDSLKLCRQALVQRISIAPGPIFSATQKYHSFIRLNCAQPWNDALESAMITLGQMVHELKNSA